MHRRGRRRLCCGSNYRSCGEGDRCGDRRARCRRRRQPLAACRRRLAGAMDDDDHLIRRNGDGRWGLGRRGDPGQTHHGHQTTHCREAEAGCADAGTTGRMATATNARTASAGHWLGWPGELRGHRRAGRRWGRLSGRSGRAPALQPLDPLAKIVSGCRGARRVGAATRVRSRGWERRISHRHRLPRVPRVRRLRARRHRRRRRGRRTTRSRQPR